jgi:DNA repair protein RecO (recombination protein O)
LQALARADTPPEAALRQFELALLTDLGYGVDFLHCAGSGQAVSSMMTYRYCTEQGFIVSPLPDHYSFSGRELHALAARNFPDEQALRTAKRFTRMALQPYLRGKPLKSRELFRYVNKSTNQHT